MGTMQAGSRRELLSQVGGAAFALAGVAQSASAKAGQFGKQDVFGIGISSPYVGEKVVSGGTAGTPYIDNVKSTYGFAPTGDILAAGYTKDVTRETAQFEKGCKLIANLQTNIDSKTWQGARPAARHGCVLAPWLHARYQQRAAGGQEGRCRQGLQEGLRRDGGARPGVQEEGAGARDQGELGHAPGHRGLRAYHRLNMRCLLPPLSV